MWNIFVVVQDYLITKSDLILTESCWHRTMGDPGTTQDTQQQLRNIVFESIKYFWNKKTENQIKHIY